MKCLLVTALCLGGLHSAVAAKVKPADIFSDHMVLQRDMLVPVWGTADPGEVLSVTFGSTESRQFKKVTTGRDGKWLVSLDPMPASASPHKMTISSASSGESINLIDILIGEVWLCSGQSNMQWTFATNHGVINNEQEIAGGKWPLIRHNNFPRGKRGWLRITPDVMPEMSAVPYFFSRELHERLKIPIGIINRSNGGTTVEQWSSLEALKQSAWGRKHIAFFESEIFKTYRKDYLKHEKLKRIWAKAQRAGDTTPAPRLRVPDEINYYKVNKTPTPSQFYSWCIDPIVGYAIRGAAWYQGESNVSVGNDERLLAYRDLLTALISDWRKSWGQDFPFLIVQLPNRGPSSNYDAKNRWAILREEIRHVAKTVPNTAVVVTIDTAQKATIHPRNKKPIGERLAVSALRNVYGHKRVIPSGPQYRSMTVEAGKAVLRFMSFGDDLVLSDRPNNQATGFVIAGADKRFVPAQAKIVQSRLTEGWQEGVTVVVWSNEIKNPVAVRYAWGGNPPSTLYNKAGLPASPFRTDDWVILRP